MRSRLSLLDFPTTEQLVHALAVLDLPMRYNEVMDQILEHGLKFSDGEEFDRENGVHHVAAISALSFHLLGRLKYRDGVDDRAEAEPSRVKLVWDETKP